MNRGPDGMAGGPAQGAWQRCVWVGASFRSRSGTLALKTGDFSEKIGRFSKTQKWILLKPSPGQETLEK